MHCILLRPYVVTAACTVSCVWEDMMTRQQPPQHIGRQQNCKALSSMRSLFSDFSNNTHAVCRCCTERAAGTATRPWHSC